MLELTEIFEVIAHDKCENVMELTQSRYWEAAGRGTADMGQRDGIYWGNEWGASFSNLRKHLLPNCNHVFYRPGNCSVFSDLRNVCIDPSIAEIFRNIADNTVIRCIIRWQSSWHDHNVPPFSTLEMAKCIRKAFKVMCKTMSLTFINLS